MKLAKNIFLAFEFFANGWTTMSGKTGERRQRLRKGYGRNGEFLLVKKNTVLCSVPCRRLSLVMLLWPTWLHSAYCEGSFHIAAAP